MPAMEELGLGPELLRVLEEQHWYLPTDVQDEAIPLILGGGDVMAAAETGSGKTGAFVLPILQVIYEKRKATAPILTSSTPTPVLNNITLNPSDRDAMLIIDTKGLTCQSQDTRNWFGCRATTAASGSGRYYYEIEIQSSIGVTRVGWAQACASFNLGTDRFGYGFGATGKKAHQRSFLDYGASFTEGDVIGCLLDLTHGSMTFSKNGHVFETAYDQLDTCASYFPAMCMRNSQLAVRFHPNEMLYRPTDYGTLYDVAPKTKVVKGGISPIALIIEPTRDLAEQVHTWIDVLKKYMPSISSTVCVGGTSFKANKEQIEGGCDIVVATPGRLMELIEKRILSLHQIQFLILDEADRLIETEHTKEIIRIYDQIQPFRVNQERLQVCFFSATLHSKEIEVLRDRICLHPIYVDLKGKDSVPDTVHHVVVPVDPSIDAAHPWYAHMTDPRTDQVHDRTKSLNKEEQRSYELKVFKPKVLLKLIETFNMDQCLIFCRTNVDCDALQVFFESLGGGRRFNGVRESGLENPFSCCVIAGKRSMEERRDSLAAFQQGAVRFLICTDVAARGIDIQNLPFVINLTLPDTIENYIHRIGRVGRKDCLGLAISLVSQVPERVWYHTCKQKGNKCMNRKSVKKGGCTMWYDEANLLKQVETRLGKAIETMSCTSFSLPPHMKDLTRYGMEEEEENHPTTPQFNALQSTVVELANMETQVQRVWFAALESI